MATEKLLTPEEQADRYFVQHFPTWDPLADESDHWRVQRAAEVRADRRALAEAMLKFVVEKVRAWDRGGAENYYAFAMDHDLREFFTAEGLIGKQGGDDGAR